MTPSAHNPRRLHGVHNVIAVGSGKGGVGKSTTALQLALSLQRKGYNVGLLDLDIFGPSLPTLLNLHEKPVMKTDPKAIIPFTIHGIKAMSIGFMVDPDQAIIWRGLMVTQMINQLFELTVWCDPLPLDYLIVDLPPGTGDVVLTLIQKINLLGAIVVSTPQDLALMDAQRAINMFQKTKTPLLGIIENMSSLTCPHCHTDIDIYGKGRIQNEARRLDIPYLGDVPLEIDIRRACDAGTPLIIQHKGFYDVITQNLLTQIKTIT